MSIGDSSRDCIKKALDCLEVSDNPNPEPAEFQLWVKTKLEESPYPLIGHEVPLVIKLHWMRQTFNNKNQKTYDEYRQGCRCSFILRKVGQVRMMMMMIMIMMMMIGRSDMWAAGSINAVQFVQFSYINNTFLLN